MAVVNCNNELLKQPASFTLHQCTVICHVVTLNVVHKISPRCILTDNAKVLRSEEHLMQLNDVGVHAA